MRTDQSVEQWLSNMPPALREKNRRRIAEAVGPVTAGVGAQDTVSTQKPRKTDAGGTQGARNKFGAVRTEVDGYMFASKGQASRYLHLKLLQHAGTIAGLQIEVPHDLMCNGVKIGIYTSDAEYYLDGVHIIEDFKGSPTKTVDYRLRKAIMGTMGLRVREVHRANSPAGWDEATKGE